MKNLLIALVAVLLGTAVTLESADAARFGGGRSSGMQRSQPIKRDAAPKQNTAPAPQSPSTPSGAGRWLAPLAGLAAGIGLMALLSHFGLSEAVGAVVMMLLLVVGAVLLIRFLMRRLQPPAPRVQYAGAAVNARTTYDQAAMSTDTAAASERWDAPADFNAESFMRHAKLNFVRLQAANDAGNLDDIREFTTPEMFAEISLQLQERGAIMQKTDVVSLDAELLGVSAEFGQYVASVRFSGLIRETANDDAKAFNEIWHIARPLDGKRNWAIAGIQQAS